MRFRRGRRGGFRRRVRRITRRFRPLRIGRRG